MMDVRVGVGPIQPYAWEEGQGRGGQREWGDAQGRLAACRVRAGGTASVISASTVSFLRCRPLGESRDSSL